MERFRTDIAAMKNALSGVENTTPSSDFDLNPISAAIAPEKLKNAAVLIPVTAGSTGLDVIFTKRSTKMRNHPGQISLPGGKQDSKDTSLTHTALREAEEEIGLDQNNVEIIGAMPKHITVSSFLVHPYVGVVGKNFIPEILTDEVSEVFSAPLDHLIKPENYIIEGRSWQGQQRYYFTVPYGPYYIWGATARMMRMLADILEKSHAN